MLIVPCLKSFLPDESAQPIDETMASGPVTKDMDKQSYTVEYYEI